MLGLEYCQCDCIVVAGNTGIGAFPAVRHIGCRIVCSLGPTSRRQQDNEQRQNGESASQLRNHSITIPCRDLTAETPAEPGAPMPRLPALIS